jgi:hypothetical protein
LFEPPGLGDDQFENGRELAEWLTQRLRTAEYPDADCFAEDWGWTVVVGRAIPVWLGCGHVEGDQWLIFCEMHRTIADRLLRRPIPFEHRNRLVSVVEQMLLNELRARDLEWFESDRGGREFNHGQSAS